MSNEIATPLQGSTTPGMPSGLFTINPSDHTIVGPTNNSLVIPSDVSSSIILESPQVASLDSLSPPKTMNTLIALPKKQAIAIGTPVTRTSLDGLTPPTKSRTLRYDGESVLPARNEEVPLLNVGVTPSVKAKEFISSLPTPTDSFTMKCTMNKEGITLDSIAEVSSQEVVKPVMPISPKEELSKVAGSKAISKRNSNLSSIASYPSPQTINKKRVTGGEVPSTTTQVYQQKILTEEPTPLVGTSVVSRKTNIVNMNGKAKANVHGNVMSATPMTASRNSYVSTVPSPLNNSIEFDSSTSTLVSGQTTQIPNQNPNQTQEYRKRVMKKKKPVSSKKGSETIVNEDYSLENKSNKSVKVSGVVNTKENKTENKPELLTYTDLLKEASIQNKDLSINDLLSDTINSSAKFLHNNVKNYTEPLPFTDPLYEEEIKEEILTYNDLLKEATIQNKQVTYDDLLTEGALKEKAENKMESEPISKDESNSDSNPIKNEMESVEKSIKTSITAAAKAQSASSNASLKPNAKTSALIESIRSKFTFKKHSRPSKKEKKEKDNSGAAVKKEVEPTSTTSIVINKRKESEINAIIANSIGIKRVKLEAIENKPMDSKVVQMKENKSMDSKKIQMKETKTIDSKEVQMKVNNTSANITALNDSKVTDVNSLENKVSVTVVNQLENKASDVNTSTNSSAPSVKKGSKKRVNEDASKEDGVTKKKRNSKDSSESKKKSKENKNKDVNENGIITKVKYNCNNISLYDSELKALLKYQTKSEDDVYPLRCICEGDYDEKEATLGLEDLVCSFPGCNKVFSKSIHLEKHFVEHGEDFRPFQCPNCTKNFRRRYDLMRHIRIHNYIIPYRCSRCLRGFTRSDSCARHTKTRQCKYFDFNNLGMKKAQPPYYSVVKDPEEKTEKEIIIVPLNKGN